MFSRTFLVAVLLIFGSCHREPQPPRNGVCSAAETKAKLDQLLSSAALGLFKQLKTTRIPTDSGRNDRVRDLLKSPIAGQRITYSDRRMLAHEPTSKTTSCSASLRIRTPEDLVRRDKTARHIVGITPASIVVKVNYRVNSTIDKKPTTTVIDIENTANLLMLGAMADAAQGVDEPHARAWILSGLASTRSDSPKTMSDYLHEDDVQELPSYLADASTVGAPDIRVELPADENYDVRFSKRIWPKLKGRLMPTPFAAAFAKAEPYQLLRSVDLGNVVAVVGQHWDVGAHAFVGTTSIRYVMRRGHMFEPVANSRVDIMGSGYGNPGQISVRSDFGKRPMVLSFAMDRWVNCAQITMTVVALDVDRPRKLIDSVSLDYEHELDGEDWTRIFRYSSKLFSHNQAIAIHYTGDQTHTTRLVRRNNRLIAIGRIPTVCS